MTRNQRNWAVTWLLALLLLASGCDPCINCAPPAADNPDFSHIDSFLDEADGSEIIAPTVASPAELDVVISPPEPTNADPGSHPAEAFDDSDLLSEKIVDQTLMKKRIVVDISEQLVYAYENNRIVDLFQASTGRNQNTALGSFKILDKKLRPYSEPWDFWMPHWMGIYWVAGLKNGFHAPPVLENGQVLWADQIGTLATNGCIMLLAEDMETLYHWSEVGTPVEIVE